MAAAYIFHIVQNHPFLDGNKRTGAAYALVFLDINHHEITAPIGSIYELTLEIAKGKMMKPDITLFFRANAR